MSRIENRISSAEAPRWRRRRSQASAQPGQARNPAEQEHLDSGIPLQAHCHRRLRRRQNLSHAQNDDERVLRGPRGDSRRGVRHNSLQDRRENIQNAGVGYSGAGEF